MRRLLLSVLAGTVLCSTASALYVDTLHEFSGGTTDGGRPQGALTRDGTKLYGMTSQYCAAGWGGVFTMSTDGTGFTILHDFAISATNGRTPIGSLILDGSTLYGMTRNGGSSGLGTVFSIGTDGTGFTILHSFTGGAGDGSQPYGSLTLSGGTLYGMTAQGGDDDAGVIFGVTTAGTGFGVLHEFEGLANGSSPYGNLTLDGSKFYGLTRTGGASNSGVVFSIDTDGTDFALLHEFAGGGSDGSLPNASLILDNGTLYGTTEDGGDGDFGTVFSIDTDGSDFSLLYEFTGGTDDGWSPLGTLALEGSTLYGMTSGGGDVYLGTIFSVGTDGTGYKVEHEFLSGAGDGASPYYGELIPGGSLPLYGMTYGGGASGVGTVFALTPEPASIVFLGLGATGLALYWRKRR